MSASHRPIWSQGLALGPQHFPAQDRDYEAALDARLTAIEPYGWGIIDARIKSNQRAAGQLALALGMPSQFILERFSNSL